jgi:Bacterial SH3 domain
MTGKMLRTVIFFTTALPLASAVWAAAAPVPGPSLRQLVSGAKLHLDTPLGTKIPVSYASSGALSGDAKGLGSYLGAERDEGRWWVARGRLCHRWNIWFEARPQCLSLQRRGARLYWQNQDGKSGTATLVAPAEKSAVAMAKARPSKRHANKQPKSKTEIKKRAPAPSTKSKELASNALPPVTRPVSRKVTAAKSPAGTSVATLKAAAAPPVIQTIKAVAVPVLDVKAEPAQQLQPQISRLGALATPRLSLAVEEPMPQARQSNAKPPGAKTAKFQKSAAKTQRPRLRMGQAAKRKVQKYRVSFVEPFDVLNVRSGPSETFAVVGGLKPRTKGVRITGTCRIDWCPIRHRNIKGWVNRFYLQAMTSRKPHRKGGVRSSAWAAIATSAQ